MGRCSESHGDGWLVSLSIGIVSLVMVFELQQGRGKGVGPIGGK